MPYANEVMCRPDFAPCKAQAFTRLIEHGVARIT